MSRIIKKRSMTLFHNISYFLFSSFFFIFFFFTECRCWETKYREEMIVLKQKNKNKNKNKTKLTEKKGCRTMVYLSFFYYFGWMILLYKGKRRICKYFNDKFYLPIYNKYVV